MLTLYIHDFYRLIEIELRNYCINNNRMGICFHHVNDCVDPLKKSKIVT